CFIVRSSERTQELGILLVLIFIISTQTTPGCDTSTGYSLIMEVFLFSSESQYISDINTWALPPAK
ncbi:hypothetical protein M9Y53_26680, partial [Klebsiella pneumoniae]|uniref:hypothetical protein n=1 Tax=Klebsiella pneumoniae TaxID=573 RepID=UPI00202337C5